MVGPVIGPLLLFTLAWRNLWRHPRRTLLTTFALGLGLALLLVSVGLGDGGHAQMIANGIKLGGGHIVVQAQGYQASRSQDLLLPARIVTQTRKSLQAHNRNPHPVLHQVCPRLIVSGLLSSAANAAGVNVIGVKPNAEQAVSLIPERMLKGVYLSDEQVASVVIGSELAQKLEVKLGSKVVLMAQAAHLAHSAQPARSEPGQGGEVQSALFRVSGIFHTGLREVDAYVVHVLLPELQTLLDAPDLVTQIAVFLHREDDALRVTLRLRTQLDPASVEVLSWREALAELARFVWLDDAFNYILNGIILVMVGLSLLNTMLMAVFERRYEFGVCAALGLQPKHLFGLVLGESALLTVISLGIGLALGLGVHAYFATTGLDIRFFTDVDFPVAGTVFEPILYSSLSLGRIVWSVSVVGVVAAIMALYPAWKAARTVLPDALRVM